MTETTKASAPDAKTAADLNKLAQNFSKIIEQSQRVLQEYLKRQERNDQIPLIDPAIIGKSFQEFFDSLLRNPEKLIETQIGFWKNTLDLWQSASKRRLGHEVEPVIKPPPGDKRFADEQWAENAVFDFIKQSYLLAADSVQGLVRQVEGLNDKTARKVQFYTRQFVDA
ncbi:MAG: class I poly(R)-hydroxyalkanoic acid synthase, partial [Candidatus Contendobacter sp.]|nr:class I poly(R)-hydroxyalkanoic acid synthase [Candidatus Contendobacter sp.]